MRNNIIFAVNAVGPLIILILLGVFLQRIKFLPRNFFEQGNKLVFKILIPCSTYCNIYSCPSLADINIAFMLYGVGIASAIFSLGLLTTHILIKEKISRSAAHQCTFRSNIPVLGAALATSLAGNEGAILLATFMMAIIPLLNIFAVITLTAHENTSGKKKKAKDVLLNILKNPLIIACILGFLTLLIRTCLTPSGSDVPIFTIKENAPFLYAAISKLAVATTPISLLVLGGLVDFSAIGGKLRNIIFGVTWRLVLAPVISIAGAVAISRLHILNFGVAEYAVLLSTFGSSIAVASAPMTAEMGGDAELARQYVMWTNVFLVISMPLEIIALRACGLV